MMMRGHIIGSKTRKDRKMAKFDHDVLYVMGGFGGLIALCVLFSYVLVWVGRR